MTYDVAKIRGLVEAALGQLGDNPEHKGPYIPGQPWSYETRMHGAVSNLRAALTELTPVGESLAHVMVEQCRTPEWVEVPDDEQEAIVQMMRQTNNIQNGGITGALRLLYGDENIKHEIGDGWYMRPGVKPRMSIREALERLFPTPFSPGEMG